MSIEKDEFIYLKSINIDPVDHYFECISLCDISDGKCITKCVEILRNPEN